MKKFKSIREMNELKLKTNEIEKIKGGRPGPTTWSTAEGTGPARGPWDSGTDTD